jgi:hypothetical protein
LTTDRRHRDLRRRGGHRIKRQPFPLALGGWLFAVATVNLTRVQGPDLFLSFELSKNCGILPEQAQQVESGQWGYLNYQPGGWQDWWAPSLLVPDPTGTSTFMDRRNGGPHTEDLA